MARAWPVVLLLVLGLVACVPGSALAAGGEGKGDVTAPRFDLTIWTIVVFVGLLLVLRKWAWGPMLQGLHKREQTIESSLHYAQQAKDEAQRLHEQLRAEKDKAEEKVRDVLEGARRDAQRLADELMAKTRTDIQTERDRLRREIDTARDQALHDIWNQAAQLATLISARVVRRRLDPEDHRRLVDEALEELRQTAGRRNGGTAVGAQP
jgi:F-type H+-transporting ATPase subunit b